MSDNVDIEEFLEWADSLYRDHPIREHAPTWDPPYKITVWTHPRTQSQLTLDIKKNDFGRLFFDPEQEHKCPIIRTESGDIRLRSDPYRLEEGELRIQVNPDEVVCLEHYPRLDEDPISVVRIAGSLEDTGHHFVDGRYRNRYHVPEDGYLPPPPPNGRIVFFGDVAGRVYLFNQPEIREHFLDRHSKPTLSKKRINAYDARRNYKTRA